MRTRRILTAAALMAPVLGSCHHPVPKALHHRVAWVDWHAYGREDMAATATSTTYTTTTTEAVVPDPIKPVSDPNQSSHEAQSPAAGTGPGNTGNCGGDLPPCYVMIRESGGDPSAVNPSSGAAGKWQMLPSTSRELGYPLPMNQYPESVQDEAARKLYAGGSGCSAWSTC